MKYRRKELYKTLKEQLDAVKKNGWSIQHIMNPSQEICLYLKNDHPEPDIFDIFIEEV